METGGQEVRVQLMQGTQVMFTTGDGPQTFLLREHETFFFFFMEFLQTGINKVHVEKSQLPFNMKRWVHFSDENGYTINVLLLAHFLNQHSLAEMASSDPPPPTPQLFICTVYSGLRSFTQRVCELTQQVTLPMCRDAGVLK